jgi:hypothetical protein
LLVIEVLMPERVTGPSWPVDMDLLMLVLAGGQECTEAQDRHLLAGAGFTLELIHAAAAPGEMSVLEARPA